MSFSVAQRGRNKLSRRLRRRVNLGRGRGVKPLHLGLNQAGGSSDSRVSYLSYKLFFIFYHPAKWYVHAFVAAPSRDPFPRKLEKIVGNLLYPFILASIHTRIQLQTGKNSSSPSVIRLSRFFRDWEKERMRDGKKEVRERGGQSSSALASKESGR